MAETIQILGIDNVLSMLEKLPKDVASKSGGPVRKALRKGAVIIRNEARLNVQKIVSEPNADGKPSKSTGFLAKQITVSRGKFLGGMTGEKYIIWLPKVKSKYTDNVKNRRKGKVGKTYWADNPAFYGKFLEYGTSKMRAHPWMLPAFKNKQQTAINVTIQSLLNDLDKLARKYLKT